MKTTNPNIQIIQLAYEEAQRFIRRCEQAESRLVENDETGGGQYAFKEVAALKRSALDLKQVLTSITQMTA